MGRAMRQAMCSVMRQAMCSVMRQAMCSVGTRLAVVLWTKHELLPKFLLLHAKAVKLQGLDATRDTRTSFSCDLILTTRILMSFSQPHKANSSREKRLKREHGHLLQDYRRSP
eukprot:6212286-Pleurochrysis_carterae.AAC.2